MAIYKLKTAQHRRYAVIPNETAQDMRLGFQAHRLLMYLLSQDFMYKIDYRELSGAFNVTRDRIRIWMNELIEYEYATRECHVDLDDGRFYWTFNVYVLPKPQFDREIYRYQDAQHQRRLRKRERKVIDYDAELWGKGRKHG